MPYLRPPTMWFNTRLYCVVLKFVNSSLSYMKKDIEAFEKVQKRAAKIPPKLKHMNYSDRLKACKLPTLHYRRIRRDMIETYKIMTEKYDIEIAPSLVGVCSSVTRGHSLRLQKKIGQNMIYVSFFC